MRLKQLREGVWSTNCEWFYLIRKETVDQRYMISSVSSPTGPTFATFEEAVKELERRANYDLLVAQSQVDVLQRLLGIG